MTSDIIKTSNSEIWLDEIGIIHTKYFRQANITLEVAQDEINIVTELARGKKVPEIIDISDIKSVSLKAREFYSGEEPTKVLNAMALIVNSSISRIIANIFLGFNKPPIPVQLFKSEEEGIEWLKLFLRD